MASLIGLHATIKRYLRSEFSFGRTQRFVSNSARPEKPRSTSAMRGLMIGSPRWKGSEGLGRSNETLSASRHKLSVLFSIRTRLPGSIRRPTGTGLFRRCTAEDNPRYPEIRHSEPRQYLTIPLLTGLMPIRQLLSLLTPRKWLRRNIRERWARRAPPFPYVPA